MILHVCQEHYSSRNCPESPDNILSLSKMATEAAFAGQHQETGGDLKMGTAVPEVWVIREEGGSLPRRWLPEIILFNKPFVLS